MSIYGAGKVFISNSRFEGLTAEEGGVMDLNLVVKVQIADSIFIRNVAGSAGGVVSASNEVQLSITNCTFQ